MKLVDTNVIVGLLFSGTPWSNDARNLYQRDGDWRTERYALVELSSALLRLVRVGDLSIEEACAAHARAKALLDSGLVDADAEAAIRAAVAHGVSAYDARYLVAAGTLGIPLTTEDSKLRVKAPGLTQSVAQALAGA